MDSLFREFRIYASQGQRYQPVDHELLLSYAEGQDGQILEEGITEAGSLASWTAAGTSYATRGVPMVPFYTFYSMFGFQRVGDLIWAAADARTRGFLIGATAGRTTLLGEGLQHQDGHSHLLASTVPTCRAYDPAFAYELAAIVHHGLHAMYGEADRSEHYYLTVYNEGWPMPPRPDRVDPADVVAGMYRFAGPPDGLDQQASVLFSGSAWPAAAAARDALAERGIGVDLWSVPSWKAVREDALAVERARRLGVAGGDADPLVTRLLGDGTGPVVAVTDYLRAVPDQVARWVPRHRPYTSLGTDGFGRSDTREALRRFFETDAAHLEVAVLAELAASGSVGRTVVDEAIAAHDLSPAVAPPWTC
jgi:pyruvate dehydrogenase E1 component